jgi:hypothetical protein
LDNAKGQAVVKEKTIQQCESLYNQILAVDAPDEVHNERLEWGEDVVVIRALLKQLGLKGISVRRAIGAGCYWPVVELPSFVFDLNNRDECLRVRDLKYHAVQHLEKVIVSVWPRFASYPPANPYEDGYHIGMTLS